MHAKNNRQNHDFQILHFLVGSCHTPDGAYALLCDLREDRANALGQVKAGELRKAAKKMKARDTINDPRTPEHEKLEAEADLAEIEGWEATTRANILAAEAELTFIENCIARLQPYRKFAHLSDAEAHEAAQPEEWKLELITRAQNFLLTGHAIPPDHFATMRSHPEFKTAILPAIDHMHALAQQEDGRDALLAYTVDAKADLPLMLKGE